MADLVIETQYGTSMKANLDERGLPVLRMNNLTADGRVNLDSLKWVEIIEREWPKFTVKRGDLIFNRTNSRELVGKTAVWHSDENYALAGYLIRVRFKPDKATADYVAGYLNSPHGKAYLFAKAKPSVNMSNFSASEFRRIPILAPPLALQEKYTEVVAQIRGLRSAQECLDNPSDNLFNALVQRAFRGEL